jgi:class 3 adenylate cyclase/WD40 repeat protein
MSGLPTGTVTFLFTDIEGSTRLLRRLGERYAEVVGRHDRLVRAACAGHGGREVSTQGDAFFVAFPRAGDAVAAAVQVQRALAEERWPEGAGVRVRMGLHTGEPVVGATDYVGLAVHRAARICALGHGGQILLSTATRKLLEDDLRPGISFRDLGQRRLKDFDRPEHLFQVVVSDLPADFPPVVSVAAEAVELPPELDADAPLVGREADLDALREEWRSAHGGAGRLVLVAGARGMGKTRLAAELAGEVHRDRGAVLYGSGAGAPQTALAVLARARVARRPTLLVLDDVDRASEDVWTVLGELGGGLTALPVLVLITAEDAALPAGRRADATVSLTPLDAESVRAIARLYAGERADADVPVEHLIEASGGVPRRVHRVAVEWARTLAIRRVGDVASRIEAERPVLRAAEDDMVENIVDLQAARGHADLFAEREPPLVCPFKGLASFDVADAKFFFGREQLVAELVARAVGSPMLGVVGPSGSGKSSVVRAGLLAALASGVLPGSDKWPQVLIRPGEHPLLELRNAMAEIGSEQDVVLAVDQFEEVYTACRNERERAAFIDAVVHVAHRRRGGIVVLAVRADFYGRCATHPALSKLLGAGHVLVGPMRRDELRRAIELPARRAGLQVEAELVDALLADVEDEPGALPLLSAALLELWQRRDGRRLRHATYQRTGGVRGAVARLAEEAFGGLDPAQQRVARTVLLRLAGEGIGGAVVRRRIPLTELEGHADADVDRVLTVLTERRLLTMSATTVEVAHEALLREWPRLRGWLDEDAQGRSVHRHLAGAAREWDERGRDPGDLYQGARLAIALEWRADHEHELNRSEQAFLDAGRAAGERAHRRLRLVLAGVAALLIVAVLGGVIAVHQRSTARTQARAAQAQRLGIQALTEGDLDRSLLLARQGVALDDSPATRSNLLTALLRAPAAIGVLRGDGNPLLALDLDQRRHAIAVGDNDGTVSFFDTITRGRIVPPYKVTGGDITAVRYSADGTRLAVAGQDGSDPFLDLVDAHTHHRIDRLLADPGQTVFQYGTPAFSPDSRVLAADYIAPAGRSDGQFLLRWDGRTGRRLGHARPIGPGNPGPIGPGLPGVVGPIDSTPRALVGFMAGGTRLVTSGAGKEGTVIRNAATLRPVRRWRGGGDSAAISPDGRVLAFGAADGSVRFLDLRTGRLRVAARRHDAPVTAVRFAPDSSFLVTAASDGRLIVWDVQRATPIETLERHAGGVSQITISGDGRTAYSAGQNGAVIVWDLAGARRLGRRFRAAQAYVPSPVVATSDGAAFAVLERDGHVGLFDGRTLTPTRRIRVGTGEASALAMAPDGRAIAALMVDGRLTFVDLRTRRQVGPLLRATASDASRVVFSGDGRWLATGGGTLAVDIWDVRGHKFATNVTVGAEVNDVSLSPDGATLATSVVHVDGRGELDIVSVPGLNPVARVRVPVGEWGRFSRDGKLLLYGDRAGRAWIFNTRTWTRGRPLVGHTRAVLTVDLSPDGRTLATTSLDGTARLWDLASGRGIGTPLPGFADHPVGAAFVDGGTHLVTVYDNGAGYLWDVRPQSWARRACEVAGRRLTRAEWHDVLPERDYAPACTDR